MARWFLGAKNDGLFIIDRPPSPQNDHPDHEAAVNVIAAVPLPFEEAAKAIIRAHNEDLEHQAEANHLEWRAQQATVEESERLLRALNDERCQCGYTSRVPAGYQKIDAYSNGTKVVLCGRPGKDDGHDCDAMGCGSLDHVLYRF